ncbi:MAG: DUF4394 domain-containing protein [Deltaproteobacteria bacterium]|nr:DUF4394 domain-containing protein [Deltaproteobacteria bacterium]
MENKRNGINLRLGLALVASLVAASVTSSSRAETIYGVTTSNQLVSFDSASPGAVSSPLAVSGLGAGEQILGIDFRPATPGVLVGLGSGGNVYSINLGNGAATSILSGLSLNGSAFGVDFNPVPNALRVVSNNEQNLRITAGGTGVINNDAALNPGNPNIVGAAYSNNVPGGVNGQTTLYVIDSLTDQVLTQGSVNFPPGTSPNTGTLFPVGALGFDTGENVGFDISGITGVAFASLTAPTGIASQLFTINLGTGAATLVGGIGGGTALRGIAVVNVPEPSKLGLLAVGILALAGIPLLRRRESLAQNSL